MESIDILIIGGGPAGISTALHLVQSDPQLTPRILILEKAHYPRHKLCGGGLVSDAEVLLENLGLDVREVPCVNAKTVHLDFKGKGTKFTNSGGHALRIIRRDEFDAWLANKARERGIKIREGIRVHDLRIEGAGVIVHTDEGDFRTQVVVGADGSNGVTRRYIFPNNPSNVARVLEVITPSKVQDKSPHAGTNAFFDFLPVPHGIAGYVWDFPTQINGIPMRCRGIYDANLFPGEDRPSLKELIYAELQNQDCDLSTLKLEGHPIRWFSPNNVLSTRHVLLVGDAAGVDPLFGEGISFALGYGKIAASSIENAFKQNNFTFKNFKRRVMISPLGQALTARWLIANLIYSFRWTWFQALLWRGVKPITMLVAWLFLINWGKRIGE